MGSNGSILTFFVLSLVYRIWGFEYGKDYGDQNVLITKNHQEGIIKLKYLSSTVLPFKTQSSVPSDESTGTPDRGTPRSKNR